uniref:Winged helix-turn helix domain-containing protein n=1 Tax=Amphimedon queenslandica TaxID=400682 RepID=A0A1X7V3G4_AMPQE
MCTPDDFNRDAIRRIIHDSYLSRDYPTRDSVLQKARSSGVFDGGQTTLSKLLKSMGFHYKKREDGKKYIYEQPRVIEQQHQYLRQMRLNREERRPEVFLDET